MRPIISPVSPFWWRWLVVANSLFVVFCMALLVTPGLAQQYFNLLFFGTLGFPPSFPAEAVSYITFMYGVMGAVMLGWAVVLYYLILRPFRRGQIEGWHALAISMAVWFIADSALSVIAGRPANVVQNLVLALMYAIPLAKTYKAFHMMTE